eukprot:scaffold429_cov114-Cylindrotheca_fusiformis.AAC.6
MPVCRTNLAKKVEPIRSNIQTNKLTTEQGRQIAPIAARSIGLALCKQLCKEHNAMVFLGARSPEKGVAAMTEVRAYAGADAKVELLRIDVEDEDSIQEAAAKLKDKGVTLTGIVNNAGAGWSHGASGEKIMNVNLMGPKRVVDNFQDLLDPAGSRIVNVGSGAAPMYVKKQPVDRQKKLCSSDITWEEIKAEYDRGVPKDDPAHGENIAYYGLSKALLAAYTMVLARAMAPKNVLAFCVTPGFINTAMTAGFGATKTPEEGTVSIRHCLFQAKKEESGWFFGSDAKRSPLHFLRNPGEPVFDGDIDWEAVAKN